MHYIYLSTSPLIDAIKLGRKTNIDTEYLQIIIRLNESEYYGDKFVVTLFEFKDETEMTTVHRDFKDIFYNNKLLFGKDLYQKQCDLEKQYISYLRDKADSYKILTGCAALPSEFKHLHNIYTMKSHYLSSTQHCV